MSYSARRFAAVAAMFLAVTAMLPLASATVAGARPGSVSAQPAADDGVIWG